MHSSLHAPGISCLPVHSLPTHPAPCTLSVHINTHPCTHAPIPWLFTLCLNHIQSTLSTLDHVAHTHTPSTLPCTPCIFAPRPVHTGTGIENNHIPPRPTHLPHTMHTSHTMHPRPCHAHSPVHCFFTVLGFKGPHYSCMLCTLTLVPHNTQPNHPTPCALTHTWCTLTLSTFAPHLVYAYPTPRTFTDTLCTLCFLVHTTTPYAHSTFPPCPGHTPPSSMQSPESRRIWSHTMHTHLAPHAQSPTPCRHAQGPRTPSSPCAPDPRRTCSPHTTNLPCTLCAEHSHHTRFALCTLAPHTLPTHPRCAHPTPLFPPAQRPLSRRPCPLAPPAARSLPGRLRATRRLPAPLPPSAPSFPRGLLSGPVGTRAPGAE